MTTDTHTTDTSADREQRLLPYLSPRSAWALALGTSVGWGSLVVTTNSYLLQGGPIGSVVGIILGTAVMLVIAWNFHFLINRYPEAGGSYVYLREAFGYDYGFLVSWFLILTYLAMFWANATSLPLFARYFFGDLFRFGRLYAIFGYDVYLGEALLTIVAIAGACWLCSRGRRLSARINFALACTFFGGIAVCFVVAMLRHGSSGQSFQPLFLPTSGTHGQIIKVACMSPWAFIGFENISHSAEEFAFPRKQAFRVLAAAVLSAGLIYIFVTLLSVSAYPVGYNSWLSYLNDLSNNSGLTALPPFHAAGRYLGVVGVALLTAALLALVLTSLIGNLVALSRLIFALGADGVVPEPLAELNDRRVPQNALLTVACISLLIPFLGRTAIGWIVDVTTIGATIIYGLVSASIYNIARQENDEREKTTGMVGVVSMVILLLIMMVPNLFGQSSMAPESYMIFTFWSILGFVCFRVVLRHDKIRHFGKSAVVWAALLVLTLVMSLVWLGEADQQAADGVVQNIRTYYTEDVQKPYVQSEESFISQEIEHMHSVKNRNTLMVMSLFGFTLAIMLSNFFYLRKREEESERQLGIVRDIAYADPLTGVKSKHAYAEWERQMNLQIEEGSARSFAVVVCDVNGLKRVNDTSGHKAGDEYIRSASELICELFDHSPVFRIGGDEFVVVLQGRDFLNRDELLELLSRRVEDNLREGKVVVSAGMSEFIYGQDSSARLVFERADAQMYAHKMHLKSLGADVRE